jgi:hypothetical protein
MAFLMLLRRMDRDELTAHGFRRICRGTSLAPSEKMIGGF